MKIITGRAGSRPACGRGAGPRGLALVGTVVADTLGRLMEGLSSQRRTGPHPECRGEESSAGLGPDLFRAQVRIRSVEPGGLRGAARRFRTRIFPLLKKVCPTWRRRRLSPGAARAVNRKEEAHLAVATFEHGTSRAQDPQLHTHCLVMNACLRDDGTSGTIESKPLYRAMMAGGAIYRAELAAQLERLLCLGVERRGSCFELEGVPRPLIAHFSQRRAAIEQSLRETGYDGPAASAMATLTTRPAKETVAREALFRDWQDAGRGLGWGPDEARALLRNAQTPERNPLADTAAALRDATERGAEGRGYFTERDLVQYLAQEAPGRGLDASAVRAGRRVSS